MMNIREFILAQLGASAIHFTDANHIQYLERDTNMWQGPVSVIDLVQKWKRAQDHRSARQMALDAMPSMALEHGMAVAKMHDHEPIRVTIIRFYLAECC